MIKVWHCLNLVGNRKFPDDFTCVAVVYTTDLNVAWMQTNHISEDWARNYNVTKVVDGPVRSTSVGDVLEDVDGGALNLVCMLGFKRIETEDDKVITFAKAWSF